MIQGDTETMETKKLTVTHKLVLAILVARVSMYIYGVFRLKWSTNELAGIFILIAILTVSLPGWVPIVLSKSLLKDVKDFYGAAIIGLAGRSSLFCKTALIIDTIVQDLFTDSIHIECFRCPCHVRRQWLV